MNAASQPRSKPDAGFTLVIVLVALVSLASMLTSLMLLSRDATLTARVFERQAVARVVDAATFARLATALVDPSDTFETALSAPGGAIDGTLSGQAVVVSLEREGGKIDPRGTAPQIVERYLATATPSGVPATLQTLRSARTDKDLRVSLLATLLPHLPFEQVAQDFTLWGETPGIDPAGASLAVLTALPDLTPAAARQIFESHGGAANTGLARSAYFGPPSRRFSLRVAIRWNEGETWVRRIPFEITASGQPVRLSGAL